MAVRRCTDMGEAQWLYRRAETYYKAAHALIAAIEGIAKDAPECPDSVLQPLIAELDFQIREGRISTNNCMRALAFANPTVTQQMQYQRQTDWLTYGFSSFAARYNVLADFMNHKGCWGHGILS